MAAGNRRSGALMNQADPAHATNAAPQIANLGQRKDQTNRYRKDSFIIHVLNRILSWVNR